MVFVRMLSKLLRDKEIGDLIVPIVPDEARTFGMEALFRQVGIYSHVGQKYEPVDMDTLLYYKEAQDGQILEEGITEAGSMSSFIAAGTAYATHGINTIPFFIYYSMFGFQRVGDLIWAGADSRTRGFLLGGHRRPDDARGRRAAAPGRPQPRLLAVGAQLHVVRPGVRLRACRHHPGRHPPDVQESGEHLLLPDRDERAVRDAADARGRARRASSRACTASTPRRTAKAKLKAQLLGSGAILNEVIGGAEAARKVRRRSRRVERHELPGALSRRPRLRALEHAAPGRDAARAVRDAVLQGHAGRHHRRLRLPEGPARFARPLDAAPRARRSAPTVSAAARIAPTCANFFEVDARFIALATLAELAQDGQLDRGAVAQAIMDFGIDAEKANPATT